jgi:hypothetical protein
MQCSVCGRKASASSHGYDSIDGLKNCFGPPNIETKVVKVSTLSANFDFSIAKFFQSPFSASSWRRQSKRHPDPAYFHITGA